MKQTLAEAFQDKSINKRYSAQGIRTLAEVALECILSETDVRYTSSAQVLKLVQKRFHARPRKGALEEVENLLNAHPWLTPVNQSRYKIKRDFLDISPTEIYN